MMRTTQTAIASLLPVMLAVTAAIAQNTQEALTDPCIRGGCVTTIYDKFQARTFVGMSPVLLSTPGDFWNRLTFSVVYSSSGTTILRPDKATFLFEVKFMDVNMKDQQAFETRKGVYLLIDDTPYPLGDVALINYENKSSIGEWSYALPVPFKILELIASAKKVEMRAGSVEFAFDDNLKSAFRHLVELAPKETIAPPKENVTPQPVKPPVRKPSSRRRRP
jgi:hypothetical protein